LIFLFLLTDELFVCRNLLLENESIISEEIAK
jgi:hypothetical protein